MYFNSPISPELRYVSPDLAKFATVRIHAVRFWRDMRLDSLALAGGEVRVPRS
jgi:hypothetical protein